MNVDGARFLLTQLLALSPTLFVHLVAIVLGLVFLNRARLSAVLTLVAASFSLLTSITAMFLQSRLIAGVNEGALQHQDIDTSMRVIGISSSILHAVCMALFLTAIFVGRKPSAGAGAA